MATPDLPEVHEFVRLLEIEFDERTSTRVGGSVAADERHHQAWGVVAVAIQQGRTQQLWQVEIRRPEDEKLVARGQVRLQHIDATD